MNEIMFDTLDELHKRLMPALKSKRKILNKSGYSYIKEDHVWDFMLKVKWQDIKKIALCQTHYITKNQTYKGETIRKIYF